MATPEDVHVYFQPLINARISGIVAVEALPRYQSGGLHELYRQAARHDRLTGGDVQLAVCALRKYAKHNALPRLHLNVLAGTVAHDLGELDLLRETLRQTGRREHEITLEIGPPVSHLDFDQLLTGVEYLRGCGFRIALDGVGEADIPPTLVSDMRPDFVKLHPDVVRGLPERRGRLGVLEAMERLCASAGSELVVDGVTDERQLALLRQHGIRLIQGDLLAAPAMAPPSTIAAPQLPPYVDTVTDLAVDTVAGPRVTEFLSAATMLSAAADADQVRAVFIDHPDVSTVVLVDDGRPLYTLERDRFLVTVTGPYGHALHAAKPAARLADKPRVVTTSTTAIEALRMVTRSDRERLRDAVVIDESGRCMGVVRATDLIGGLAELKAGEAVALNPLTHLPGSDSIAREVTRRMDRGDSVAVGWLDIDRFKAVNDIAGFSAGDDLIRSVGRSLTDAATTLDSVAVGHVGGDDFLVVAEPGDLDSLADKVLDPAREANGIPITLSLATLECARGSIASYREVSQRLAPIKRVAKRLHGTSWATSRPGVDHVEIHRGPQERADPDNHEKTGILHRFHSHGPRDEHSSEPYGDPTGVQTDSVAASDPSHEHTTLARLHRSSRRFTDLLSVAPVGIGLFDESECLVDANTALCDLLGYQLDELRGMTAEHLAHPQNRSAASQRGLTDHTPPMSHRMLIRSDGTAVYCELHSGLSVQDDGTHFWLVVFQDITERLQAADDLHYRATHDELTGLPNRAAVRERLDTQLADPRRARTAALLCDIDNFKRINDAVGHDAGDDVLRSLATRLDRGIPENCTAARLSGDEFVVVCADVDEVGGLDSLATLVSSLLRTALPAQGGQLVRVSASIGAAVFDGSESTGDDLLRFADAAKTEAKKLGTGHVSRAGRTLMASADQQLQLEGELRLALAHDELALHYQPVVDCSGAVMGAEALVRWPRPDGTVLTPGAFLPVAEQAGMLRELDRWVLRTALREAASWQPRPDGRMPGISINVAELTPGDPEFADEVSELIAESGIDWHRVVLEVVETSLADVPSRPLKAMRRLTGRGVRFAVDDFGIGYSSLARLRDLPAQILKVDRRFVSGAAEDPTDLAVVRAVVDMADAMGRHCIAEGVEHTDQLRALRELGINRYQGWLFAPALRPEELREAITRGTITTPPAVPDMR